MDAGDVAAAVTALRAGRLVAFPTETVYGLGADARNVDALARLYEVKGRPRSHPVIVHIGDPDQLDEHGRDVPDDARLLALACWPGPLTVIVRRDPDVVPDAVTGGRATVGLRVPDHPLALELLRGFGSGVAAPSANRFGAVSPTTAADVRADLGDAVDVVLDGGPCRVGVESTIVDCTGGPVRVLRPGGITSERIAEVLGHEVATAGDGEGPAAPGRLPSHYAPRARVVVVRNGDAAAAAAARAAAGGVAVGVVWFGGADGRHVRGVADGVTTVAAPADVAEYARVLYRSLRRADELGLDVLVAVEPTPTGVGAAVADRLRRAAADPN